MPWDLHMLYFPTSPMIRAVTRLITLLWLAGFLGAQEQRPSAIGKVLTWQKAKARMGKQVTVESLVTTAFTTREGTFLRFSADPAGLVVQIVADTSALPLPRPLHVVLAAQTVRVQGKVTASDSGHPLIVLDDLQNLECKALAIFLPRPAAVTAPEPAKPVKPAKPVPPPQVAELMKVAAVAELPIADIVTVEEAAAPPEPAPVAETGAPAPERDARVLDLIALGADINATSKQVAWAGEGPEVAIIDGNPATRWSSEYADNQSVTIDMKRAVTVEGASLSWEVASPKNYDLKVSLDGLRWDVVSTWTDATRGPRLDQADFPPTEARYIRLHLKERATEYGLSLYELELYGQD